jgi:hypothetical protein
MVVGDYKNGRVCCPKNNAHFLAFYYDFDGKKNKRKKQQFVYDMRNSRETVSLRQRNSFFFDILFYIFDNSVTHRKKRLAKTEK